MFGTLGFWEILLILGIAAVIFGGKKLPQLGRGLGEGITNFKNAIKGGSKDDSEDKPANDEKDN
jgi:sec-independent protein translocase protein TatA